jgi:hypothetical protein
VVEIAATIVVGYFVLWCACAALQLLGVLIDGVVAAADED